MIEVVEVGPAHPCWKAYGDDDWNGHTFINWVHHVIVGKHVKLKPPSDLPKETIRGVWQAVASSAFFVELEGKTVHILQHGQSHCRMPGVPGEWPEGHIWLSFEDADLRAAATCAECRRQQGLPPPGEAE